MKMKTTTGTARAGKLMAFLPAAIIITVTAIAASGASIIPGATAASTVGVTATVSTSGSADPDLTGGDCSDNGTDETFPSGTWNTVGTGDVTDGCVIQFYTNNAAGAEVQFANADGGAAAFFCGDADATAGIQIGTRDCTTDANRVEDVVGGSAITQDTFGLALKSIGGGGGNAAGSGVSAADGTPTVAETIWHPIATAAAQLCTTNSPNTSGTQATCGFAFGAMGDGGSQAAGDYYGSVDLTITQN